MSISKTIYTMISSFSKCTFLELELILQKLLRNCYLEIILHHQVLTWSDLELYKFLRNGWKKWNRRSVKYGIPKEYQRFINCFPSRNRCNAILRNGTNIKWSKRNYLVFKYLNTFNLYYFYNRFEIDFLFNHNKISFIHFIKG